MRNRNLILGAVVLAGGLIILVVMFNLIRNIFDGGSKNEPVASRTYNMNQAERSGAEVRYTLRGIINAEEDHREIRIIVNEGTRRIEIVKGYQNQIIKAEELPNNKAAYRQFMDALTGSGFGKIVPEQSRVNETQSCPLGTVGIYEAGANTGNYLRTWSNSCTTKAGTFGGNTSSVQTLFRRQIPNYNEFTLDVKTGS